MTSSNKSREPRTRPFTSSEKKQSTFVPAKGVASKSSLSTRTESFGKGSGLFTITEVSPELNLPPSSRNLRIY